MTNNNKDFYVTTNKLTKMYKKEKVVNEVSMNISRGSIYGLLGPNGAGKSTTMKMLVGLIKPNYGEIYVDANKWSRGDLKNIGALIENPPIYNNLTARENLKVYTTMLGIEEPEKRITNVLKTVEMDNTNGKLASKFSMGMRQRLGIATAIINNPKLLILDEPTNGLDPVGISEIREIIKSFSENGMTIILSSHILSEIQLIADDIGIICNGQLAYENKNSGNLDLESLFLKVIHENRRNSNV